MNFDRYAGLASAVGIVLILMIATWLNFWGPIDVSHLKDWQTLMTGVLALVAAGIAYRGAIAKVRHDREVLAAENMRRKVALYLKLDLACRALSEQAQEMDGRLSFPPIGEDRVVRRDEFKLSEPPELEEAWTYLDLFPVKAIAQVRNIRGKLRELSRHYERVGETAIPWRSDANSPYLISVAHTCVYEIQQSASLVVDLLEPTIKFMAPQMDAEEMVMRLYGEPAIEDE